MSRAHHEKEYHRLSERAEVVVLVQAAVTFDVHKERHTEYGEYEHDQKQQQTYVEQSRQWHGQREQKGSDTFCPFHQTQYSSHFGHADHSQKRRRHEILGNQIAQHQTYENRLT